MFFLFCVLFVSFVANLSADDTRIYIRKIHMDPGIAPEISSKVQNIIQLNTIKWFENYVIMTDDVGLSIYKKISESQKIGAEDQSLDYLANSLGFEELIDGELRKVGDDYHLNLNNIQFNKNQKNFSLKNKVYVEFQKHNMEYYVSEACRALKNKNYTINKINAPLAQPKLEWKNFSIVSSVDSNLAPIRFSTSGSSPDSFFEGMYRYLVEADDLYSKAKYLQAADIYMNILNSINTLSPKQVQKLNEETLKIRTRIRNSYSNHFSESIKIKDREVSSKIPISQSSSSVSKQDISDEQLNEFFLMYDEIYKKYQVLPDFAREKKILDLLKERLFILVLANVKKDEARGDEHYKNLHFDKALEDYNIVLKEIAEYKDFLDFSKYQIRIQNKIQNTKESGASYVDKSVRSLLVIAESENSRAILERSMKNPEERIKRKESALGLINKAYELLGRHSVFVSKALITDYNSLAEKINEDNQNDTVINAKNIALFPFRYLANIGRGISDIFVFKFGTGIGAGAEVFVFGATPFIVASMNSEVSSAYGVTKKLEETSPLSRIYQEPRVDWKETSDSNRLGTVYGVYGFGVGICSHFGVRFCNYTSEKPPNRWRKYTTAQVSVGLVGGVMVGMELHRVAELPAILAFQDPDLFDLKKITRPRFRYFQMDRANRYD